MRMHIFIANEDVVYTDERIFGSAQEANAFREGIEYANDSALTVVGIDEHKGQYSVFMFDEDA
jgi:hypothetical protein